MLVKTREQLSRLTVNELKDICRQNDLKGYSKLKKAELVEFVYFHQPEPFEAKIQYIYNDNLNMYSILYIDPTLSIKEITSLIREHAAGKPFSNQEHNEKIIKAFYRAGFRAYGHETLSESETLALLNNVSSIHLIANTNKYNMIEQVENEITETQQEQETSKTEYQEAQTKNTTYTVGNRSFASHSQASNKQPKLYWYQYRLRGLSPGCQPDDFIKVDHSKGRFGIIAYNRPLTQKELNEYELLPFDDVS
ncbi:Rho termination factor N-terminal domain-containing protein [Bacillus smithii]|uniref:defense against restriction DarA-related protein n=1 Tax=Bacillus smithii TaxID=1479 RepID=UPI003D1F50A2